MNERLNEILGKNYINGILSMVSELEKEENKDLLTQENKLDIINAYKYQKLSLYTVEKFYEFISKTYNDKESYDVFLDNLVDSDNSFEHKDTAIVNILEKLPKEHIKYEWLEKAIKQIDFTNRTNRNKFLVNIPEKLQVTELYSEILKDLHNRYDPQGQADFNNGNVLTAYIDIFEKTPIKAKNAEMLINSVDIISINDIEKNLNLLADDMEEKGLYPDFLKKCAVVRKDFTLKANEIMNVIPEKYKTEENIFEIIQGLVERNADCFEINRFLSSIENTIQNYSQDFFENIVRNVNDGNGMMIYKKIPEQYKNMLSVFYSAIEGNATKPDNISVLIKNFMPEINVEDKNNFDYSKKILNNIIKTIEEKNTNNFMLSIMYEKILDSSSYVIKDINERIIYKDSLIEKFANNVKTDVNANNQIIYTPDAMFNCYNAFKNNSSRIFVNDHKKYNEMLEQKSGIREYIEEIIKIERENIENKTPNLEQIKEYEIECASNETKKKLGYFVDKKEEKNTDVKEKNPFWSLYVFLNLMPDKYKDEYRNEIYSIIRKNIPSYDNGKNTETINYILEIMDNNEELFYTINNDFFLDDKYINLFGKEKYEILIAYPEIQEQIINMNKNELSMFSNFINYSEKELNVQDIKTIDWVPIADIVLKGINNKNFKEINDVIKNIDFKELSEEKKKTYLHVISKNKNWFGVNNIEDLEKYEEKRKKICTQILEKGIINFDELKSSEIPYVIKSMSKKDMIIFARLQLEYGLDIEEATNLVNKYGKGLDKTQKEEGIGITLLKINEILNTKEADLNKLCDIDFDINSQTNSVLIQNFESKARESYMRQYQKVLYNVEEHNNENNRYETKYNGEKIKVFEPDNDFKMIVHALGAYSTHGKREDYYKDWNMPKVVNHGLCTSFVSNNNLGIAKVDSVLYGFSNFSPEQLQLSSPWDIVSSNANIAFSISSTKYNFGRGIKFLNPKRSN